MTSFRDLSSSRLEMLSASRRVAAGRTLAVSLAFVAAVIYPGAGHAQVTPDTDFGTNGAVTFSGEGSGAIEALTQDSRGGLVFANSYGATGRILASGKIDSKYGVSFQYADLPGRVEGLAAGKNGIVFGAGMAREINQPTSVWPFIFKLTRKGRMDRSFGKRGVVYPRTTRQPDFRGSSFHAISLDADNRIVAGGRGGYNRSILIARYHANGKPDRSFGNEGEVKIFNHGHRNLPPTSVADIKTVGNAVLATGMMNKRAFVVKLKSNGNIDQRFGRNGWAWGPPSEPHICDPVECALGQLAVDKEGSITASSEIYVNPDRSTPILFQLNRNGLRRKGFADEGLLEFTPRKVKSLAPGVDKRRGLNAFENPTGGIAALPSGEVFAMATASLDGYHEKNLGLLISPR